MSYCGSSSLVKRDGDAVNAHKLKCRSWSCPDCQPERARRLVAEAHGGEPCTFITLTTRRREGLSPIEAAAKLSHAWRLVRLRLMRRNKHGKFPFICVMEATKLGWPHLHILTRVRWVSRDDLSKWMGELIDAPNVDIRRIDNKGRVAAYVAKYVGKAPHQFGTCKRYWKSRDYELRQKWREKKKRVGPSSYEKVDCTLEQWRKNMEQEGFFVLALASDHYFAVPLQSLPALASAPPP